MNYVNSLYCPVCNGKDFILRYEAKYVYSYIIDSNAPGINNDEQFFSFLYDSREQKESNEYIECLGCGTKFLCHLNKADKGIDSTSLDKIVDLSNIITESLDNR